jgi:RES domain-containing protein
MGGTRAIEMSRVVRFRQDGWHRLIPKEYSHDSLSDKPDESKIINQLDGATSDSAQAERKSLPGIGIHELVFGFPHSEIINDAFCHPGKDGNRFNDNTRGAWYAADSLDTSIAEVAFHRAHRLADVVLPSASQNRPLTEIFFYDDWNATFDMDIHSLEPVEDYMDCLKADPIPSCYAASQALANRFLRERSNGILYPSVRLPGHQCVACFRPALIYSPRRAKRIEITLRSVETGYQLSDVREIALPNGTYEHVADTPVLPPDQPSK